MIYTNKEILDMSLTYVINFNNEILQFNNEEKSKFENIIKSLEEDGYKFDDIITILNRLLINCKEIKLIDRKIVT